MFKLVIFDADGTLTPLRDGSAGPPILRLLPGVAKKCAELRAAGVLLAIASNQSQNRPCGDINTQLTWTLYEIDASRIRWAKKPERRKPRSPMLDSIMDVLCITPSATLFVGDHETDQQAAMAARCNFMWAEEFFNG